MRPPMKRRVAFTFIELLVVFAIIVVLLALLFPAVQRMRETGNRTVCLNNIMQASMAMINYQDAKGTLPMGSTLYHGSGTWQVLVLPYVEKPELFTSYQGYDGGAPQGSGAWSAANVASVTGMQLKVFTCPSDTVAKLGGNTYGGASYHNYAANFGNTAVGDSFATAKMRTETTFNGLTYKGAPFRYAKAVPIRDITDGASTTLMLAEVVQGQGVDVRGFTWWGDGAAFVASLRPNDSSPDFVTHNYCNSNPPNPPTNCVGMTTADSYAIRAFGVRSRHRGGVTVSMCDGSCRFVSDSVSVPTWQQLSTSQGAETLTTDY